MVVRLRLQGEGHVDPFSTVSNGTGIRFGDNAFQL